MASGKPRGRVSQKRCKAIRRSAAARQGGRCYYCDREMWDMHAEPLEAFCIRLEVTQAEAQQRLCTSEHLIPVRQGARFNIANIVAACLYCNRKRHTHRRGPPAWAFRLWVKERVRLGEWPKPAQHQSGQCLVDIAKRDQPMIASSSRSDANSRAATLMSE
jgi:hypothetical protein